MPAACAGVAATAATGARGTAAAAAGATPAVLPVVARGAGGVWRRAAARRRGGATQAAAVDTAVAIHPPRRPARRSFTAPGAAWCRGAPVAGAGRGLTPPRPDLPPGRRSFAAVGRGHRPVFQAPAQTPPRGAVRGGGGGGWARPARHARSPRPSAVAAWPLGLAAWASPSVAALVSATGGCAV